MRGRWQRFPFRIPQQPNNTIIGGPETLKWVNPEPSKGLPRAFMLLWGNHKASTFTSALSQAKDARETDPFDKYFVKIWQERQDPLWWGVVTTKFKSQQAKIKRTVRSWAVRRMKRAFETSLNRHGYAKDGTPLEGSKSTVPLSGTAQFMAEEYVLTIDPEELGIQMDYIMQKLLRIQELPTFGKTIRKTARKENGRGRGDAHGRKETQSSPSRGV
ncbi:hypothetical protein BJ878DRAFT_490098 [Calycina marina]|uniref:Uncharacterized protein n=1 Tax=Calycina marina TaxID=1763456 RepID=A0A9P8CIP4_9HELO|nr:hypothetical protein BJ878DRAFT_490098 [Calycina marina]